MMRMMQGMKEEINNKMDTNTDKMEKIRGEMWQMGHGLQAGIMALAYDETRTARKKSGGATCWDGRAEGECTSG